MKSLVLALLVVVCGICYISADFTVVPVVPIGFGDMHDPDVSATITGMCREKCRRQKGQIVRCRFTHPKACNLYIDCLRFLHLWVIHGLVAPEQSIYDDTMERTMPAFTPKRTPYLGVCGATKHPCETKLPVPRNGQMCGGYLMCEEDKLVSYQCPEGKGFSAWTGACDLECKERKRKIKWTKCGVSEKGVFYLQMNETFVIGEDEEEITESQDIKCPAATSYQRPGTCGCDRNNVTAKPCETVPVAHFSSSDNSWELARNNTPLNGGAALVGDADIAPDTDRTFRRAASFRDGQRFVSWRLNGNDLGLYFDLKFTFQTTQDNGRPGVTINDRPPFIIALADNSADGIEATYGCMLRVVRRNRGKVVCYVRPSKATDVTDKDDVTIDSPELDLTRKISVEFSKDNNRGQLKTVVEGNAEQVTAVRFPSGVRAIGNLSPLIIGSGTGKRPLSGYIDDMDIRKYCGPFMKGQQAK